MIKVDIQLKCPERSSEAAFIIFKPEPTKLGTTNPAEVMNLGLCSSTHCTSILGSKVRISTHRQRTAMIYGGWCSAEIGGEKQDDGRNLGHDHQQTYKTMGEKPCNKSGNKSHLNG